MWLPILVAYAKQSPKLVAKIGFVPDYSMVGPRHLEYGWVNKINRMIELCACIFSYILDREYAVNLAW